MADEGLQTPDQFSAAVGYLGQLLDGYRQVLWTADKLPMFGFIEPNSKDPIGHHRVQTMFGESWWDAVVIGPVVRFFLAAHMRTRLAQIERRLAFVILFAPDPDPALRTAVEEVRSVQVHVKQLSPLRLNPALLTSVPGALFSLISLFSGHTHWLIVTALVLLAFGVYGMLIVAPVANQAGFRWKRAFLLGGYADPGGLQIRPYRLRWHRLPQTNLYRVEDQVFRALDCRKGKEFQFDIILSPTVISFILYPISTVVVSFIAIALGQSGTAGIGPAITWAFMVGAFEIWVLRRCKRALAGRAVAGV